MLPNPLNFQQNDYNNIKLLILYQLYQFYQLYYNIFI